MFFFILVFSKRGIEVLCLVLGLIRDLVFWSRLRGYLEGEYVNFRGVRLG